MSPLLRRAATVLIALSVFDVRASDALGTAPARTSLAPEPSSSGAQSRTGTIAGGVAPSRTPTTAPARGFSVGIPPAGPGLGEAPAASGSSVGTASAPSETTKLQIELEIHGYYRARGSKIHNLFPIDPNAFAPEGAATETRLILHRLRLEPVLHFAELVKLRLQVDALDDVLWGDNAGLSSVALFGTEPTSTPRAGVSFLSGEAFVPSVDLKRAWIEVKLPVGQLRVGRMPSQWGMGLLANGGDGFDDDFGDNHFGSTADRILFGTRPVAIVEGLQGRSALDHPLIVAYAFDKVVTTPLDVSRGEDPARRQRSSAWLGRRFDQDGDGRTGEDPIDGQDNDGDDRTDEDPPGNNDVNEHVFVALWNQPSAWGISTEDDLKVGTYIVYREQKSTESFAWIVDLYGTVRAGPWYGEAEALTILGKSLAIPLGTRDKRARVFGGAGRFGYLGSTLHLVFEAGYASGDGNVLDRDFTRRALHPDYNVGLLLYEEVLAESTARRWGPDARGLWSNGGVYSSFYFFPRVRYFPISGYDFKVIAGVLTSFAVDPECATIYDSDDVCRVPPNVEDIDSKFPHLGTELDLALKYAWWENHMEATLELGYLFIGSGLLNETSTSDPRSAAWTLQSRIAFVF